MAYRLVRFERITFDNFQTGDYGELGPESAPSGSFQAMNMLVTADGKLCPRPGWINVSASDMPNGKLVGLAPTKTAGRGMLFIVGNKVYTYDWTTRGAKTEIGTLDSTPSNACYIKCGTVEYYITVPGDKSYRLMPVSNTIHPLTGSPGGNEIEVYGLRLLVAGDGQGNRIKWSDPDNFDSWPAENFLDVGNGTVEWQITSMREQNNHLAIMLSRRKFVLTGVPGANDVLRRAERYMSVLHPGQADIDEEDRIWYIPAFRPNPDVFDGVKSPHQFNYLSTGLTANRDGDTPSLPLVRGLAESMGDKTSSTVLITQGGGDNNMLLYHNGVWTRHNCNITISGMTRGGETGDFYTTDGGSSGAPGKIYMCQFDIDRPAFSTDTLGQPGDDSTTPLNAWVKLPQFWMHDSTGVAPVQVAVDFVKYHTGATGTNHFDINVVVKGREGVDDITFTYPWDEAQSAAGASIGDFKTARFSQGIKQAIGGGFEVSLTNVRGVKIQRVIVDIGLRRDRPVVN